ncbi:MAG TPA: recombination protein RecR [Planctomycetaceae bacterium]|nr:recombination protein RecR [Planctomycetaceae bacterium]
MPPQDPAGRRGAIARLIDSFADLPGIGRKSAERLAHHVLQMPPAEALAFADAIREVKQNLRACRVCFNLAEADLCDICSDSRRDRTLLCVVEQVRDLLAIEQAGAFRGVYHVLRGRVAPLEGTGPESLTLDALADRVGREGVREVIMGTTPNVEGDATAIAVMRRLEGLPVEFTRLARGLTVGASLQHANRDMLADAINGRQKF